MLAPVLPPALVLSLTPWLAPQHCQVGIYEVDFIWVQLLTFIVFLHPPPHLDKIK